MRKDRTNLVEIHQDSILKGQTNREVKKQRKSQYHHFFMRRLGIEAKKKKNTQKCGTVFTLSIWTSLLLTILVLIFEPVLLFTWVQLFKASLA